MKRNSTNLLIAIAACVVSIVIVGCNVGMTPAGGSEAEIKAAFDKMPLEDRAKSILSSPAPMDFKVQRIKEMYAKEGKEVPPDLLKGSGTAH